MDNKTCTMCGETKPATLEFFYAHKQCKGGVDSACRVCRNAQRNEWKRQNKDRLGKRRRQQYAERYAERHKKLEEARAERFPYRVQAERLFSGVRSRSKDLGFERPSEFQTKAYIEQWLRDQPTCECCGVEFDIRPNKGERTDASPSIDRFDLDQPYTVQNTKLICWRCNNIKRNYDESDLRMVADWIEKTKSTRGNETSKFG